MILTRGTAVPVAWVIQLATFGNESNASRLINKLRKLGYDAYSRDVRLASGKLLVRVFVGPEINKTTLQQTQQQVLTLYRLI